MADEIDEETKAKIEKMVKVFADCVAPLMDVKRIHAFHFVGLMAVEDDGENSAVVPFGMSLAISPKAFTMLEEAQARSKVVPGPIFAVTKPKDN